jgi:D-alanyl-D-alanine carboxypeptidase
MNHIMAKNNKKNLKSKTRVVTLLFLVALFVLLAVFLHPQSKTPGVENTPPSNADQHVFNKSLYSMSSSSSLWVVVNKKHALSPTNYVPADLTDPNVPMRVLGNESMQLRSDAAQAVEQMFTEAKKNDLNLMVSSGYRSYNYQVGLYNGYVRSMGQENADKTSARPGHSEHQTGLALDIEPTARNCELQVCFAQTPEGQWLVQNAYKYGFLLRYPADKVAVTGYEYEPWHYRYIGRELAAQMHQKNIKTLEEFFNISGGTSY